MNKKHMVLSLTTDLTDEQLKAGICQLLPEVIESQIGCIFTIQGYDDDPRDLWDIPECVNFMKRCVETGFISLLEVSTSIPEVSRIDPAAGVIGLGGIEVWLISENMINNQKELSLSIRNEFAMTLALCNEKAEDVLKNSAEYSHIESLVIREIKFE